MGQAVSVVAVAEVVLGIGAGLAFAGAATAAVVVAIAEALDEDIIHQPDAEEEEEYPLPEFLEPYVEGRQMNIAITGESGVGKSSLINVILGRDIADTGGISETTKEPQPYEHPISEKIDGHVYLWDLPGAGTPRFPLETYIQTMGLRYFDAAIVVLHNRVKEANVDIINELRKYEIPVLCVVNKMDTTVDDAKHDTERRNLKQTFQLVSSEYKSKFEEAGCDDVRPFRLSTRALRMNRGSVKRLAKDPLNCDWESFNRALVGAVRLARGFGEIIEEVKKKKFFFF